MEKIKEKVASLNIQFDNLCQVRVWMTWNDTNILLLLALDFLSSFYMDCHMEVVHWWIIDECSLGGSDGSMVPETTEAWTNALRIALKSNVCRSKMILVKSRSRWRV